MPYVKVNDVNLYYKILSQTNLSQDAGFLIVLHGGPGVSDHNLYFDYWSKFSNLKHIVFFDMRGHGKSDKGEIQKWSLEQWGKDVYELCKVLNIHKPIVAGVSFGGWVAISYALQYPNHPSKLIFCNTEACIDNQAQIDMYTEKGGISAGEIIRKIYQCSDPKIWSEYIKYCAPYMSQNPYTVEEIKKVKANMKLYHDFYLRGLHRFNYLPQLSNLKIQILILGGTADPEHPLKSTLAMNDALTDAKVTLEIMKDAGDPVYRDYPDQVKQIVTKFISNN